MSSLKRPLAVLAVLASVSVLAGCGDDESSSAVDSGSGSSSAPSEREGTGTECDFPEDPMGASKEVEPPPSESNVSGEVPVTISTSIGDLQATLDADAAPCTVTSFVSLAEQAYFDSTTCHRLTTSPGFGVLQCGDPTGTGTGGPGYSIPDELEQTKSYPAGTLAMAKTNAPNSGGSQFFICYTDTQLPPEYTVFGSIDEASNKLVADAAAAGTVDGGPDGTPKTPVEIETVTVD
ncbi:MAG TPA: peptidylprolyl isomerase [Nocardioides sp.]|uniref:peptidylprolyl isomerase n=1 Tax=Nocardioides sp. TaxID=35761 RepID=UPI002C411691|nr:peptidylprolyl isomerase [Nocardioides sp.]HTW14108.1 peptidylprolyl isomerase [Nocardioides sp.]